MKRAIAAAVPNAALAALLAACAAAEPDVPAVLVEPTAQARAELSQAVSSEFGGAAIPLAADALTTSSDLVLERARPRDAEGRLMNGRETGRPQTFRLVRAAGRCVLVHDGNGHRIALASAVCRPR